MTHRYVNVPRYGGADVLELETRSTPSPGPGEALVRVVAAGVSFGDVLLRVGVIPVGPKPPYTPGYDITGVVESIGEGVTEPRVGQLVTGLVPSGGYAEFLTMPAHRLVPVPDGLAAVEVSAIALNYFVAYQMLHRIAQVKAGQSVLVHGAAGGVGTALLQLAALADVDVHGTSSAGKKNVVTRLGAEHIDYSRVDFVGVMRVFGGAHAVFDPVGGAHFLRSYRSLRSGGVLVGYGQSDAMVQGRPRKSVAILGFVGGLFLPKLIPDGKRTTFYNAWSLEKKDPDAYRTDLGKILDLLAARKIDPIVAHTLRLDDAAKAHELLERSAITGKIVLETGATR